MDNDKPPKLPKSSIYSRIKSRLLNRWLIGGIIIFFLGFVVIALFHDKWNVSLDVVALIMGAFGSLIFAVLVVFKINVFEFNQFELPADKMRKKTIEKIIALSALILLAISFFIQIYLQFQNRSSIGLDESLTIVKMPWDFILDLGSKLILIISGWLLTKRVVHNYQKDKDIRDTRERILTLSFEVMSKYFIILDNWDAWARVTFQKPIEEQQMIQVTNSLGNSLEAFQREINLFMRLFPIYFQLSTREKSILETVERQLDKFGSIVSKAIDSKIATVTKRDEVIKEGFTLCNNLNGLLNLIESAKPK